MPADLILRLASQVGDPVGNLLLRYVNTVNAPIVSASWLDRGWAVADTYTLVFTNAGGTVTCTVDCNVKNPYRNMTGAPVVADGSTPNEGIVPGVGIVVSASVATGWTAVFSVGQSMDALGAVTPVLGFGVVEAGTATAGVRIAVVNVGDAPAQQTKIYSLPGLVITGTGLTAIVKKLSPHTSPTRHKMATTGTYTITFADYKLNAGLGCYTADVYVGGVKAIEDARLDGSTVHQYGDGIGYVDAVDALKGLAVIFANTSSDPTGLTLTLKVTADAFTWLEFAPDVSGSPGTYANQDLDLTQSGQPTGTIAASGAAYLWARENEPEAATVGDMRCGVVRTRALTT